MADIQYLNYGDLQIELLALLKNLADLVQGYVLKQPWSNKRKEKFMSAYSDIMNRGILGASNATGQWTLDVGGDDLGLDSKDRKDREMYQEAAYFIQLQMAGLPTKSSLEEAKEEEKKDLPVFDNKYFTSNFMSHIGHDRFGGRDWTSSEWNEIDKRGDDGLRGTNERAKVLASYLRSYSNSLKEGEHNFEGSPFTNLDDFKTRVNTAISELENGTWNLADKDSLNRIGLNPADWFNNGSGDYSDTINPETNLPFTYAELSKYNLDLAKLKAELDAEASKLKSQAAYDNTLFFTRGSAKLLGRNPLELKTKYKDNNGLMLALLLYSLSDIRTLTPDEQSEIHGAYRYLAKAPIDGELLKKLQSSSSGLYKNAAPNRFKKIDGIDNLIWDSAAGQVIQIQTRDLYNANKNQPLDLFEGVKTLEDIKNESLQHKVGEGLTDDMIADITALGLDSVSAGAAFAPGYGTAVSAVSGVLSTLAGAYADRARGESWKSTLGTAGTGLLMDAVGLVPGLGVAGKAAKMARIVSKGAKWIGPLLGGLAAMSYGPGAISAFNKFKSGKHKDITAEELRDFTYAMRAIAAGGIRKAGSTYQGNRTLKRAIAGEKTIGTTAKGPRASVSTEKTPASITTKNGQIKLDDDEFKTLSGNGNRQSKIDLLKSKGIKEEDINWKGINPIKGRFKISSKSSLVSGLLKGSESGKVKWNSTSADYKGIRRFSNENLLRNYMKMSGPNTGVWKWMKDRWNGDDILNKPSENNLFNFNKQKALPFIKPKYTAPKTTSLEIIPISKALPLPGDIHKGNTIDNTRTGSLSPVKGISLGEANLEFNDFHRMYISSTIKGSKVPLKPFGNGYGTSKNPEEGSLTFGNMTATLTKLNGNRGFSITFGKTDDTVIAKQYKNILELRNNFAMQLNNYIKKLNNVKETAALLRLFKAKGWLKQGGTIDRQRIQNYKEFINK